MTPSPDWINNVTPGDLLGGILAVLLLFGIVLAVVKWVNPILVKVTRVLDLILGRPAEQGLPAQPSFIERLDSQDARLDQIALQVTPNHGSTTHLAEQVRRHHEEAMGAIKAIKVELHQISAESCLDRMHLHRRLDALSPTSPESPEEGTE